MADIPLTVSPSSFSLRQAGTRQTWTTLTGRTRQNVLSGVRTALTLQFEVVGEAGYELAGLTGRLLTGDRLVVPFGALGYVRRGSGGTFLASDATSGAAMITLTGDGIIEPGDIVQIGTSIHVAGTRYQRGPSLTTEAEMRIWPRLRAAVSRSTTIDAITPEGIYEMGPQTATPYTVSGRDLHQRWYGASTLDLDRGMRGLHWHTARMYAICGVGRLGSRVRYFPCLRAGASLKRR